MKNRLWDLTGSKRILISIIIISMVSLSCNVPSIFGPDYYKPGEAIPATTKPYAVADLDPRLVTNVASARTGLVEQGDPNLGETISMDVNTGKATGDENGIVSFADERLKLTVPVVALDRTGKPISGLDVSYVSAGDLIMIVVSDGRNEYRPANITVDLNELQLEEERKSDASEYPLSAAILITIYDMGDANVGEEVEELLVDSQQFMDLIGDPIPVCASPELLGSLSSESLGFIFVASQTAEGMLIAKDGVVLGPRDVVIPVLSERGVTTGTRDAILFQRYFPSEDISGELLGSYQFDPDTFGGFWMPVGRCQYVPDLVGMTQAEAESTLGALPLQYFTSMATELGEYEAGSVEAQNPGQFSDSVLFGSQIETMLPEVPASDTERVELILSIGQRPRTIPDLLGMTLLQAEEALTALELTMQVTLSQPCLNVDAGEVSSQAPLPGTEFTAGDLVDVVECTGPPSTGDVQVTLIWNTTADLDLAVLDPEGFLIFYGEPASTSGGRLDVDANGYCENVTTAPIENIYWDFGGAPAGYYLVSVLYSIDCAEEGAVAYTVIVTVDGVTTEFTGTVNPGDYLDITNFTR